MLTTKVLTAIVAAACSACVSLSLAPLAAAYAESTPTRGVDDAIRGVTYHQPRVGPSGQSSRTTGAVNDGFALERFAGKDRYLTAVAISQAHFPDALWPPDPNRPDDPPAPVDSVIVASGYTYADALPGGAFAAGIGPLLLVPGVGPVPSAVKAEIKRLDPKYIYILGGSGAVSYDVETQLKPFAEIRRFEGKNRYDTAAGVGMATADKVGGTDTVLLTSGEDFADALAGGASAALQEAVLLLTRSGSLPAKTAEALQSIEPKTVQVLGGPGAVSESVLSAVRRAVPGVTIQRIHGAERAATTASLSRVTFPQHADETFFVNGWNYPDALAAAPLAWFWGASVLLSRTECAPTATIAEDARLTPDYRAAIGGPGAVSDAALRLRKC